MSKLLLAWAFVAAHVVPVVVIVIAAFLIFTNVRGCRDSGQSKEAVVMAERLRADSATHVLDSVSLLHASARLDSALQHGTQVVERWRTVKVPVYLPVGSSAHDTIQSFAKRLSACYQAGDSLVESAVKIQSSCSAYRDTASKTISNQKIAYAHLDSLYKIGKPPKRWSLGPYIGYGFSQDSAWKLTRGFSAGLAITYAIIRW